MECLVTKLPSSVEDNTLPLFGKFQFNVIPSDNFGTQFDALFTANEPVDIKCTGDVGVYKKDYSTPYSPLPNKHPFAFVKGGESGGTIIYDKKYVFTHMWIPKIFEKVDIEDLFRWNDFRELRINAKSIKNLNLGEIFEKYFPSTLNSFIWDSVEKTEGQTSINISSFKQATSLNGLTLIGGKSDSTFYYSDFIGNISELKILPLTHVNLQDINSLNSDIRDFGEFTALTSLTIRSCSGIYGRLEDMLDLMVLRGRNSGELKFQNFFSRTITYKGSQIPNGTLTIAFTSSGWREVE